MAQMQTHIFVIFVLFSRSSFAFNEMSYQSIMAAVNQFQHPGFQPQLENLTTIRSPAEMLFLQPMTDSGEETPLTPWKLLSEGSKMASRVTSKRNDTLERCLNSLSDIANALKNKDKWALRMFDAMGKPPSGILDLNIVWLGSYYECLDVKAVKTLADNSTQSLFTGRYSLVTMQSPVPDPNPFEILDQSKHLNIGLCVPSTCSPKDVENLLNLAVVPYTNGSLEAVVNNYQPEPMPLTTAAIAVLVFLSVIGCAILVGTLYDVIIHRPAVKKSKSTVEVVCAQDESADAGNEENEPINTQHYTPLLKERQDQREDLLTVDQKSGPLKILLSLSIYNNAQKILSTKRTSGTLDCLHGIRFLSMTWVILGHTTSFLLGFSGNTLRLQEWLNRWTFQAIGNATVSVDSFFVLSGALVSYLLLKELDKKNGPRGVNWALFYFHRFWRLTPAYMLVLGTHTALLQYLGDGPVWVNASRLDPYCKDSWWTNLLYINNLVHSNKQCMPWGWYLANDMQFFIISPLVILGFYYKWFVGGSISFALILINFVSNGIITAQGDAITENIYQRPWSRVGPYVIGIITGYLLHITERSRPKIHKGFILLGWVSAAALNLTVLYGLAKYKNGLVPMPLHLSAFYAACSRTVWGVGLAWVIFACCRGYGGFVNTLLSWSALVPLSRLTYCAYLVHPVVLYYFNLSLNQTIYMTEVFLIWLFLGGLVVSYAIAFVTSLVFEAPMMGLEKVVFPK